jgi:hypothetical protein
MKRQEAENPMTKVQKPKNLCAFVSLWLNKMSAANFPQRSLRLCVPKLSRSECNEAKSAANLCAVAPLREIFEPPRPQGNTQGSPREGNYEC